MHTIHRLCLGMSTVLALAACAGPEPQHPVERPAAIVTSSQPAAATGTAASTRLPRGFRRVMRDGQEYICQRDTATASRTEVVETCLTAAEYESRTKNGQDFLQGLQSTPGLAPTGNKAFTPGF